MTTPGTQVMTPIQQAQQDADERRRLRLQSGGQAQQPYYQQQGQVFQDTQAPTAKPAVQSSAAQIPQDIWKQRLQTNTTIGQTQTAGVVGSIATQKAKKAEADYQAWIKKNNDAIKQMQDNYNKWIKTITGANSNVPGVVYGPGGGGSDTGTGGSPGVKAGQYIYTDPKDQQIAAWARQAGWAENLIPTLIAVAEGESSRSPTALNDKNANGSTDYGLVQINSIHRGDAIMNDPRIGGASSFYEGGGWKDPVKNLIAAKSIYDASGGWGPWVAFTSGHATYKPPYTVAKQDQPAIGAAPVTRGGTVTGTPNGLRSKVLQQGMVYVGKTPYVYAGDSLTQGVDCSGLVHSLYGMFGIKTPRVAAIDARPEGGNSPRMGNLSSWESSGYIGGSVTGWINQSSDLNKLAPGDLITFYNGSDGIGNEFGHVVIYAGNGQILEAAEPGTMVRVRNIRSDEMSRGNYLRGIHLELPGDGPDGR